MSYITRRALSTLIPPKIASPSGIGAASDAVRMQKVVSFYEKLPRGPAPAEQSSGLFSWYKNKYFKRGNESAAPLAHLILSSRSSATPRTTTSTCDTTTTTPTKRGDPFVQCME